MNYYASGGQAQGLKSLAQELPKYGRYGDNMVAHISSDEARMLQAMGGSGTINPDTGLPEYFLKNVFKPVQQAWKGITSLPGIKQISDVVTPVLQTVAPYAPYIAPFIPGVGPLMAAGLGAAGAGFGGKGRSGFDFKRGLMGGMTAYGLSNLYAGLQAAASTGADATASQVASGLGEGASSAAGSQADLLAQQAAGFGEAGLKNIASSASYANPAANFAGSAAEIGAQAIAENAPNAGMFEAAPRQIVFDKSLATSVPQGLQMPSLSSMPSNFATEMGNAGSGLKNLVGLGDGTVSQAANAIGTKFGTGSAAALFTGASGMAALDEQQKYLDQQLASGTIAQTEYNAQSARISESRARAEQAVRDNPYQFAVGGTVSDEAGMDEARGLNQGNMSNGFMRGGMPVHNVAMSDMSQPTFNNGAVGGIQQFAVGGNVSTPRFLSGGGDGMSDSIPATINGRQEARLADGEFVIPADVVSHLGNGSSKAGAKRLYSMMDKVRSARTGTKKQAPAVNTNRLMPA
jgi:hypothetical protein